MTYRPIGGVQIVGMREPQGAARTNYAAVKEHRREQAAARAAVLLGEWLDGAHSDRETIERAYHELEQALE